MLKITTAAEQVASHLEQELLQGRWSKTMPGRDRLAKVLGVDGSTIERALGHLEEQGVIQSQGAGKRRLITLDQTITPAKRILIVPYELEDRYSQPIIVELLNRLHAAGHRVSFTPKSLIDLKHDSSKVESMMKDHPHEACILVAASRPVLEMAARAPQPCFALFGPMAGLKMAGTGPMKIPALQDAVDCLHRNGHRRIVMLSKPETMKEGPSATQRAFLERLEKHQLSSSNYNLPIWDNTREGLRKCLNSLFQVTPPTAILVDDWMLLYAIQNFLTRERGKQYRNVACISTDHHPSFKWCSPAISHVSWDPLAVCQRVMQWVNHVAQGKRDISQRPITAKFVEGEDLALSE